MDMEDIFYTDYHSKISVDTAALLVAAWNTTQKEVKIYLNDKKFFEDVFENKYDAAWAASAGDYRWSDTYVYINKEGYLTSFRHWDDDTCPIDFERVDVCSLIKDLEELKNKKGIETGGDEENSISRAIHDALQQE